ncbi:MAG: hypothetical protein IKP88_14600 [Lachnospiraceae bacterium]|nr:hypothetical protein [Lachnospiraceae bacterium]
MMIKEKNSYMHLHIKNQILEVENFNKLLRGAAKKDDGIIDEYERKILKKIKKASDKYIREMKKICEK